MEPLAKRDSVTREEPVTKAPSSSRKGMRIVVHIVLPCLICVFWLGLRVSHFGSSSALLAIGPEKSAFSLIHAELPNAYVFEGNGYDGMYFYVIARHPFDFEWSRQYLDSPNYRLRRIVFPALAKVLAPQGGTQLIYAFAALSIVGVALGGWWCAKFPGAQPWLPIMMAFNPGIIASLWTSTADVLAAGLTIACLGAAFQRRFTLAIVLLIVASLTKETSLVAVAALACWPNISWRQRIAHLTIPTIPIVIWSIYLSRRLNESIFAQSSTGNFGPPFVGWIHASTPPLELLVAFVLAGTTLAATIKSWRIYPQISVILALSLAVFVCFLPVNAVSWWGFSRAMTVALPLSAWILALPRKKVRVKVAEPQFS